MRAWRATLLSVWMIAATSQTGATASAQVLIPVGNVVFRGDLPYPTELSGVATLGDRLVVCPDEAGSIYVFKKGDDDTYQLERTEALRDDQDAELDLEGAASDDKFLYVVGSHSLRRKSIDETSTYQENRKRLSKVGPHDDSYRLFRLKFTDDGAIKTKKEISLRELLEADAGAAPFIDVPSKENGIDIEGIAVREGRLFVGFRGPVLRGEFVPIAIFDFKDPNAYELVFVRLGGRGIRDLTSVGDGFLIIAGSVGDGDGDFRLYHWNGKDCVPGFGSPGGAVRLLGRIPSQPGANPEGIVVLAESEDEWELLIVDDGNDIARKFIVSRPED